MKREKECHIQTSTNTLISYLSIVSFTPLFNSDKNFHTWSLFSFNWISYLSFLEFHYFKSFFVWSSSSLRLLFLQVCISVNIHSSNNNNSFLIVVYATSHFSLSLSFGQPTIEMNQTVIVWTMFFKWRKIIIPVRERENRFDQYKWVTWTIFFFMGNVTVWWCVDWKFVFFSNDCIGVISNNHWKSI